MNNFSVLALDSINWGPTQIGLMTASIGVIDILIQGVLLGILLPASASAASSSVESSDRPSAWSRWLWSPPPSPSRGCSSSAR